MLITSVPVSYMVHMLAEISHLSHLAIQDWKVCIVSRFYSKQQLEHETQYEA